MAFTAKDVQSLREKTGVGMMECKKALTEADGDMEKAAEILREKGLAAAAKKAGRVAADGIVDVSINEATGVGVAVEVNSETDFVAKNAEFQTFVKNVSAVISTQNPKDVEELRACKYLDTDRTVEDVQKEQVLKIGENIQIRRFARYDNSTVNSGYVHMGGKIGVLAAFEVSDNLKDNPVVQEIGHDVCLQAAAMNPSYLDRASVPAEVVEKEKEILTAQAMNEGKPAAVAEKMVMGRINKFYQENCLIDQAFVKDNALSIGKYIEQKAKELGGEIKLVKFVRFEKGEGIEKREENFADEIAKMIK